MLGSGLLGGCLSSGECNSSEDYCSGTVRHYCSTRNNMFRTNYWDSEDCADTSQVCASGKDEKGQPVTLCALSTSPDPRCGTSTWWSGCAANASLDCQDGYVTHEEHCGSRLCVLVDTNYGLCLDPAAPCFGKASGWDCDGNLAYECDHMQPGTAHGCPGCRLDQNGTAISQYDMYCTQ